MSVASSTLTFIMPKPGEWFIFIHTVCFPVMVNSLSEVSVSLITQSNEVWIQHISSITASLVRQMYNKGVMTLHLSFLFAYPNCCHRFSHWWFLFPKILSLAFYIKTSLRRFLKFQSPPLTICKYRITT